MIVQLLDLIRKQVHNSLRYQTKQITQFKQTINLLRVLCECNEEQAKILAQIEQIVCNLRFDSLNCSQKQVCTCLLEFFAGETLNSEIWIGRRKNGALCYEMESLIKDKIFAQFQPNSNPLVQSNESQFNLVNGISILLEQISKNSSARFYFASSGCLQAQNLSSISTRELKTVTRTQVNFNLHQMNLYSLLIQIILFRSGQSKFLINFYHKMFLDRLQSSDLKSFYLCLFGVKTVLRTAVKMTQIRKTKKSQSQQQQSERAQPMLKPQRLKFIANNKLIQFFTKACKLVHGFFHLAEFTPINIRFLFYILTQCAEIAIWFPFPKLQYQDEDQTFNITRPVSSNRQHIKNMRKIREHPQIKFMNLILTMLFPRQCGFIDQKIRYSQIGRSPIFRCKIIELILNKFLFNLQNNISEFKEALNQKQFVISYTKQLIEILKNDANFISIQNIRLNIQSFQLKKLYYRGKIHSFNFPSQITMCQEILNLIFQIFSKEARIKKCSYQLNDDQGLSGDQTFFEQAVSFANSNDLSDLAHNISNLSAGKMILGSMLQLLYHSGLGKSGGDQQYNYQQQQQNKVRDVISNRRQFQLTQSQRKQKQLQMSKFFFSEIIKSQQQQQTKEKNQNCLNKFRLDESSLAKYMKISQAYQVLEMILIKILKPSYAQDISRANKIIKALLREFLQDSDDLMRGTMILVVSIIRGVIGQEALSKILVTYKDKLSKKGVHVNQWVDMFILKD